MNSVLINLLPRIGMSRVDSVTSAARSTRRTVCTQESPRYVAFRTKRNFLDSQHFCKTLSGDMAVATGPEAARNIKLAVEEIEDQAGVQHGGGGKEESFC